MKRHFNTPEVALIERATHLFPHTAYTSDTAVNHARRAWVRAIQRMRQPGNRPWVCDALLTPRADHRMRTELQ